MKKIIYLLILLFLITSSAFAHSIFQKEEAPYTDKTLPFFVNIYSDNGIDIKNDEEEQFVHYNPQVHFFNKKLDNNIDEATSNYFVSAIRTQSVTQHKQSDTIEFMTDFKYNKWDLKSGISQEVVSGINQYYNSVSIMPTYNINDTFSVFGGVSHSITSNYDQAKFGFKVNPFKFKRLGFEVSVSNYTKHFGSYRQKLNFDTIFKI